MRITTCSMFSSPPGSRGVSATARRRFGGSKDSPAVKPAVPSADPSSRLLLTSAMVTSASYVRNAGQLT